MLSELRVAGWHEIRRTRDDRVVIGPGGLVVLAERSSGGRIRDEWADEARAQALVLERMTGRTVEAIVVLSRPVDWTEPRPLRGATVIPAAGLAAHLTGRPRALAPMDIEALRNRMRHALATG